MSRLIIRTPCKVSVIHKKSFEKLSDCSKPRDIKLTTGQNDTTRRSERISGLVISILDEQNGDYFSFLLDAFLSSATFGT